MAYSLDALTEDCYPGTTCLINKLGIQDEEKLAETEAAIVLGKASLLDQEPIPGVFDFTHYRAIHHFLFCDLYDWAGRVRTINISKKGTIFVPAAEIQACADACFTRFMLPVEVGGYASLQIFRLSNVDNGTFVVQVLVDAWAVGQILHDAPQVIVGL